MLRKVFVGLFALAVALGAASVPAQGLSAPVQQVADPGSGGSGSGG